MKILLVEDEDALLELLSMEVEAAVDCKVIALSSGNKAIDWLKHNDLNDLKLIISDNRMPDGSGAHLYEFVSSFCPHIPFALTTGSTGILEETKEFFNFVTNNPKNTVIQKPFNLDKFTLTIKTLLDRHQRSDKLEYYRLALQRIRGLETVPCDVFIQLSEEKFVKVVNANDSFPFDLLKNYEGKKIEYFYVRREDYPVFSSFFTSKMKSCLEKASSDNEVIYCELKGLENLQDHILHIGIDEEVVETMKLITSSSVEIIRRHPDLIKLMTKMMENQDYLAEHSIMTSYIAGALALEMEWTTDSTLQKLATAALLHDVCLADSELAKKSHLPRTEWEDHLKIEEIERIKRHPLDMAELISKSHAIDPHVDLIIFNHHEKNDGSGFPRGLTNSQIFPLACLFIVAEDFANRIYGQRPSKEELKTLLSEMEGIYTKGNFKKAVDALKKIILDETKGP